MADSQFLQVVRALHFLYGCHARLACTSAEFPRRDFSHPSPNGDGIDNSKMRERWRNAAYEPWRNVAYERWRNVA
jgi:hypothetical protein